MRSSRDLHLILLCIIPLVSYYQVFAEIKFSSREFYRQGLLLASEGKTESAIDAFKTAVKKDGKFADAYHQLGLAYIKIGTIESRKQATFALKRALKLDKMNIQYHLDMAKLSLKKGMKGEAKKNFERALKLDPAIAEAYYHLGLLKEQEMLWYNDLISPQDEGILFTFNKYANEDLRDAKKYFAKAIESDQDFALAYYHLALIQFELSDYSAMADNLEKALEVQPDNKDFYLFLGSAYHRMNDYFLANQNFDFAKHYMSNEEFSLFESVSTVLTPEENKQYTALNLIKKNDYQRKFWKQRDPLFMTEFNERVLEHYSRFAYANLRFGYPEKGIVGWKTDQGKAYIRFGPPKSKFRTRPKLNSTLNSGGGYPIVPSQENWNYADFNLVFEDETLNRRYKFKRHLDPDQDSKLIFEQLIKQVPESYELDIEGSPFKIPHQITQYMGENGQTKIALDFGIPRDKVTLNYANVYLKKGFFVFDADWNDIAKKVESRRIPLSDQLGVKGSPFIIDRHEFQLAPESYKISLELVDESSGNIGKFRRELNVRNFDPNRLEISDLMLADNIQADSSSQDENANLKILPNLFRRFAPGQSIFVYFESYNLDLDEGGFSHYTVETILRSVKSQKNTFAKFAASVGGLFGLGNAKQTEVSTLYEYQGNSTMEPTHSSVRLADTKPGQYILVIRVKDIQSNKTVEKSITFEIVKNTNKKG
ncbi:tetratricopeptide repeat protein [candidate division KSB1 bacterium]|nr:tetratricopeptide repeat protein [candidate division KSB1 bacterium]